MLWANPAVLAGLLLAESYARGGAKLKLGSVMSASDMPYFLYTDAEGEQVPLPCTERLWSERQAVQAASYKVMPLVSLRGRPEVRLASFNALAGRPLAGFWDPVTDRSRPPPRRASTGCARGTASPRGPGHGHGPRRTRARRGGGGGR
ncbi:hypothetical protein ACFQU2_05635 [Siccirubricoccus deserti]